MKNATTKSFTVISAKMNTIDMKSKLTSCLAFEDYYTEIAQKAIHV